MSPRRSELNYPINTVYILYIYVVWLDGECWLQGVHIAEYAGCGSKFQHPAKRTRKLLLSRKEVIVMYYNKAPPIDIYKQCMYVCSFCKFIDKN